jgi:NitT/TauT family transport system substrate-binding protein
LTTSRRRWLGTAAVFACGFPGIVRAQSGKALTIGYVPSTLFAPLFVAQERGYLRDSNINATLSPIVAGSDSMALVGQGLVDCCAAGLSAAFFNAVNRGLALKFVASTGYQPSKGHPTALMMREDLYDAGAHDAGALRGKKIGWLGNGGATSGYYVAVILRKFGMTMKDIDAVNIAAPDQEVALERKAVDALFASAPFTRLFEQKKLARIVGNVPAGISGTGIFFGPSLLDHPEIAHAVMRGLRRGAADVAGSGYFDPDNVAAMAKYTNQPQDLIRSADRYDFKPDLRVDLGTIEDMQKEFIREGLLAYKSPINEALLVSHF